MLKMIMPQAVILVGGKGTRLGQLTKSTPKPLLSVGGVPFVYHLLEKLDRYGFRDVLFLTGYLRDQFSDIKHSIKFEDLVICFSNEDEPLGTGGALAKAHSEGLLNDRFFLINGDTFFDFDFDDFVRKGMDYGNVLAVKTGIDNRRYSRVHVDKDNLVTRFSAPSNQCLPCMVNGGAYIFEKIFDGREVQSSFSLEMDLLPKLVAEKSLWAAVYDDFFVDIGIPEDLELAREYFSKKANVNY